MPKPKAATSYKIPQDAKDLLDALAEKLDTPKTYVLADAIRYYAAKRGVAIGFTSGRNSGKNSEKTINNH